ncbi:GumC family protein [Sphingomonas ursincola]|uniref:non-specific protein-tyrosine kinase n=1 Tax=Sphingomonas ursincola TaxID=56361 RepID=A0A7V8UAY2_9SPHN|nr:polysaccharide biosynthesis tyrosine autokinase [Sphingomonas ursincola]MBA1376208.1 polysaccharide biosynthesis tyrosine autokinase [Sphingomonas ursincola]
MTSPQTAPALRQFGEPAPEAATGSSINLLSLWRTVVRRKVMIIGVLIASLALGAIATLLSEKQYTASATLEISRQENQIVDVQALRPDSAGTDLEFYQTQYSLLEARSLAARVANKLRLGSDAAFIELFAEDEASRLSDSGERNSKDINQIRREQAIDLLLEHVTITPVRGSALVTVSFTSPDPAISQKVANTWVEQFIAASLARKFDATSYARQFLEQRLEELRARLEDSERRAVSYAQREQIIRLPGGSTAEGASGGAPTRSLLADELERMNSELAKATGERVELQSKANSLSSAAGDGVSAALAALRSKRTELSAEYANLLTTFAPEYPKVKAVASQLGELDKGIAREERRIGSSNSAAYQQAVQREANLKSLVSQLKAELLQQEVRSIQYNIFQRDADTNRELYNGLLQRYKEIGVAGGVGTNNISIIDEAKLPEVPSSPNLLNNLLLALLAGSVLAAGSVFAAEQIADHISDPDQVEPRLGLPLLGIVPATNEEFLDVIRDRKSEQAEAYIAIITRLAFATVHGTPRSLCVISTRPAEGKSSSAVGVALALSKVGKRVLLIDGDMRSPSIGRAAQVAEKSGLSNYLAGQDDFVPLIVRSEYLDIDIMPAGPSPLNAAELLTGDRLNRLLKRLEAHYDHVVIDSPPVLGLADAPLIASNVEACLYTVESATVRVTQIRSAMKRLPSQVNLVGVMLTKVDTQRAKQLYGYDYGYGYGKNIPTDTAAERSSNGQDS